MKKATISDDLKSHKYDDWLSKSETYENKESSASIIYQQYAIHLIAASSSQEGQQKIINRLI